MFHFYLIQYIFFIGSAIYNTDFKSAFVFILCILFNVFWPCKRLLLSCFYGVYCFFVINLLDMRSPLCLRSDVGKFSKLFPQRLKLSKNDLMGWRIMIQGKIRDDGQVLLDWCIHQEVCLHTLVKTVDGKPSHYRGHTLHVLSLHFLLLHGISFHWQ